MAEFGERLKRAREDKGMTQQTLSEQLYVTRQAVSRWECGARYPDLLTAKKLSEVLEVSLDELLSGTEMKKYAEKSPIVESPVIGRVQSALYAFVGAAYLLINISAVYFLMPELAGGNLWVRGYIASYMAGNILIMLSLFAGLLFSVHGKITPRKAGAVALTYFGAGIVPNLFIFAQTPHVWPTVTQSILYLICILVIAAYYFQLRRCSPALVYAAAAFELIRSGAMYFQMIRVGNDLAFIVKTIWLTATAGYMGLTAYQAYALERKRRLYEICKKD